MPTSYDEDEPEDYIDESEHPDAQDADWTLDPATTDCPHCGKEISEDAQRCPHCRQYISEEEAPGRRRGWVAGVVIALIVLTLLGLLIRW